MYNTIRSMVLIGVLLYGKYVDVDRVIGYCVLCLKDRTLDVDK